MPNLVLRFPLSSRRIVQLLASVAGLNLIVLLGAYLDRTIFENPGWILGYLMNQFNIGAENRLAAWYSSMLLFLAALGALGCWLLDRRYGRSRRDRLLGHGWVIVALLFAGLSLDEMGSLHERLPELLDVQLFQLRNWVGVLIIPIAIIGLFLLAFAWFHVRQSRAASGLMILGVLLFLSVPLQEHLEHLSYEAAAGLAGYQRPALLLVLEEGAELFGVFSFFAAFLLYARMRAIRAGSLARSGEPEAAFRLTINGVAIGSALLGIGMLVLEFGLLPRLPSSWHWGIPSNWFPSVLCLLVGGVAAYLGLRTGGRGPLLLLAVLSLFLSADHGAAHEWTELVLRKLANIRLILDAGLVLVILATTAWMISRERSTTGRALIIGWASLVLAGILVGGVWNPLLSFAGYTLLLLALTGPLRLAPSTPGVWARDVLGGVRVNS